MLNRVFGCICYVDRGMTEYFGYESSFTADVSGLGPFFVRGSRFGFGMWHGGVVGYEGVVAVVTKYVFYCGILNVFVVII
jgi:hypothetical protein